MRQNDPVSSKRIRDCVIARDGVNHPLLPSGRSSMRKRVVLVAVAGVLVLLGALAAVFLTPLGSTLVTPQIVKAIEARLAEGYSVHIGESRVDPTTEGLDLRLDDVEIRDGSGTRVFAVPQASLAVDRRLLTGSGDFPIRRIKLIRPHLTLRVEENGTVALSTTEGGLPLFSLPALGAPQPAPTEMLQLLEAIDASLSTAGAFGRFEVGEVSQASLFLDDRRRSRTEKSEMVDVRIARLSNQSGVVASASSSDPSDPWSITATLAGNAGDNRNFDVGFSNLSIGRLIYEALRGGTPAKFDGRLSGHLYAQTTPQGQIANAGARLDVQGFEAVSTIEAESRAAIERARVEVEWNGTERQLRLLKSDIYSGTTRLSFGGQAKGIDASEDEWEFAFAGTETSLPGADAVTQALRFDRIELSGRLAGASRKVTLDQFSAKGRTVSLAAQAVIDLGQEEPHIDLALASSRGPLAALLRVWPAPIAPNTRNYLAKNVRHAIVEEMSLAVKGPLDVGPAKDRSVRLDAKFQDGVLNYLNGVPPATGISGSVAMGDQDLNVVIDSGRVDTGQGKILDIAGTRFSAPDHRPRSFPGEIAVKLNGPLAGVGNLLAAEPLAKLAPGVSSKMGGEGNIAGTIFLRGIIGKETEIGKMAISVEADAKDISLANAVAGKDLADGDFRILLEPTSASIRGQGRIGGATTAIEALIARDAGGNYRQTSIAFSLDPSKITESPSSTWKITGPVSARLSMPNAASLENAVFEADLTGASVDGPAGIKKSAGQGGQISFGVTPSNNAWRLGNFRAEGAGIDIRGTLDISEYALLHADLPTFRATKGDDSQVTITRFGNGYKVAIRGSSFDGRAAISEMFSGSAGGDPIDLDVDAKLGTLIGKNGEVLTGLDLRASRRGKNIRTFQLAGRLGSGPVEGRLSGDKRRFLSLRAADAGATLRFLDIYGRVGGGQLNLDIVPGDVSEARLGLRNFQVVGDQQLAAIARGSRPQGGGMNFTKMDARFKASAGKIVIDDCIVYGNELGATLSGEINYGADKVEIRGTFLPAYAINNLFGKLPVIGTILGGGSKEGLLGITFEMDGAWSAPRMKVNPLSAVAPGFLRKLFEFRDNPASAPPG
ncbi:YhdP family protein [Terrihabitans sp. B22-R8]|uniref:YhdP family protein n=1 Tax=Terrihabitans sp. B22-R8 TaxID=3425128 RepID=UPI00403C06F1